MPARRCRIGLALLVVGCSTAAEPRSLSLMPGSSYRSPLDNYTVVVPPLLGPTVRQSETTTEDRTATTVSFGDDFGTLLEVRSRRIADDDPLGTTRQGTRTLADRFLNDQVLPALRATAPGSTVLHTESAVDTAAGPATFVVVNVPGGSVRSNHEDAVRGILAFPRLRWVYAVTVQQWPPTPEQPKLSAADRDAQLLAQLRQAVALMTFN